MKIAPEEKLLRIKDVLFPEAEHVAQGHYVEHDAAENLGAALYDMKRLGVDAVCCNTVARVVDQLNRAKKVLGDR